MTTNYVFTTLFAALGIALLVGGCFGDSKSNHICSTCLECEECIEDSSGQPFCAPVSHDDQECVGTAIHWLDSCGGDEGVAEVCPANSTCEDDSGGAECVCTTHWTGNDCNICPPNWDGDQDCNDCLGNWDLSSGCTQCENQWIDLGNNCGTCPEHYDAATGCNECEQNWDPASDCTECLGNWDPASDCAECTNSWIDEDNDCGTCPDNWDPAADCDECLGNWDLSSGCTTCENHWIADGDNCETCSGNWDPAADCDECLSGWDETTNCIDCLGNYDAATSCADCLGNWDLSSGCTTCENHWIADGDNCETCPGNWNPAADCNACFGNYKATTDCATCEGNWDLSSGCTTCENNWVNNSNDCGTCPGNWDPAADCNSCLSGWQGADCDECVGNFDPASSCTACLGNWDFSAGCTTCMYHWIDEGNECGTCPGNWNATLNCDICENHWIDESNNCGTCPGNWDSGADCNACVTGYDPATDCDECIGNWDPSTNCASCLPGWSGTDCETQLECVRYVDLDTPHTTPDGHSWTRAFPTVQEGIDAAYASIGTAGTCEVWVAAGTYFIFETSSTDTIEMLEGVEIYGGFDGTETSFSQRDIESNVTILDGRLNETSTSWSEKVTRIITGCDDSAIDGFTVTNGRGGMVATDVSPTISNMIFTELSGGFNGSAIAIEGGSPIIENCAFSKNYGDFGGALGISDYATPVITDCVFQYNWGDMSGGGAVASTNSSPSIDGCLFQYNSSHTEPDIGGYGGAIYFSEGSPVVKNCIFDRNYAATGGAAIFSDDSSFDAINCVFTSNHVYADLTTVKGGGIWMDVDTDPAPTITNSVFWRNEPDQIAVTTGSTAQPVITYSNVEGGYTGTGNFDADPLFFDMENGDLRLREGSPCIDAADGFAAPDTDILGEVRWDDPSTVDALDCGGTGGCVDHADMGAYEAPIGKCTGNWDPYQDCTVCTGHWVDASDNCGTCPAGGDPATDCWECLAGWDPETGCTACANQWEGAACDTCPGNWDQAADCAQCENGFDPDDNCTTCLDGWSGAACEIQTSCVRYVDIESIAPNPNGKSWGQAFTRVQDGIDAAFDAVVASGSTITCDVWVTQGSYVVFEGSTSDTIQLMPYVHLYGGFGGIETATEQRDIVAYPTLLDGRDPLTRVRVFHVVTGADDSIVDGFTIRYGGAKYSDDGTLRDNCGAGLLNENTSTLVRNCYFYANVAFGSGGAAASLNGTLTTENCLFTSNTSIYYDGSAVYSLDSDFILNHASMYFGSSMWGEGMVLVDGGSLTVQNSILRSSATTEISVAGSATVDVTYSFVEGGYPGTGNVDGDPNIDYSTYQPQPDSPAIDAADSTVAPTTDGVGNPRVDDPSTVDTGVGPMTYVDMGAYEYQP